jgi:DNA polymerase III subunit chi
VTDVFFYHVQSTTVEAVLPSLLQKCLQRQWRVFVHVVETERLHALDAHLWTYTDDSFLPHGVTGSEFDAQQPILLASSELPENNSFQVCCLVDGAPLPEDITVFTRVLVLFDGQSEEALQKARAQWRTLTALQSTTPNLALSYWQQNDGGGWVKKMEQ